MLLLVIVAFVLCALADLEGRSLGVLLMQLEIRGGERFRTMNAFTNARNMLTGTAKRGSGKDRERSRGYKEMKINHMLIYQISKPASPKRLSLQCLLSAYHQP